MSKVDEQYLSLINDVLSNGVEKDTRSGKVKSVFGRMLRFDLNEGLPVLTTKKMFTKGVIVELLWFLSGNTNIKFLLENGVHIWDDDAYRHYCTLYEENRKLNEDFFKIYNKYIPVFDEKMDKETYLAAVLEGKTCPQLDFTCGDLGDVYGKQWRRFGETNVDQIKNIIQKLKETPDDRRLLCVAYNPDVADKVALPPCHTMFQFYTKELTHKERVNYFRYGTIKDKNEQKSFLPISDAELDRASIPTRKLSLMWSQRSVDVGLGLPFNILSYAILVHLMAQVTNMVVDELVCSLGDTHVYVNQIEGLSEQLSRDPNKFDLPTLELNPSVKNIDDFTLNDIKITNYTSYPKIALPLSVG